MWPSDSNKIFNVALRRKSLPTPALNPSLNQGHVSEKEGSNVWGPGTRSSTPA